MKEWAEDELKGGVSVMMVMRMKMTE